MKKKLSKKEKLELAFIASTLNKMEEMYKANGEFKKAVDKMYKKKVKELSKL